MKGIETLKKLKPSDQSTVDISELSKKCYEAMDDDLNSPVLLSHLFEGVKYINSASDGTEKLSSSDLDSLKMLFDTFVFEIMGLKDESEGGADEKLTDDLIKIIVGLRQDAKNNKDFATSDRIRQELKKAGVVLKDLKDGVSWERE
jgi:cysteinyl-tRNA synthetase